ncbi:MAG: 16S rRNA (cytosine(967)-C(5))-methyltransferase RsmB [Lachnospiraceae bacterium]|nr:16S rRNA (cytosine(967)-C(5))-methyltransferase RsmB [Lachnospiraceae bacterium]
MVQEKAGASPVNVRKLALDLLIQVMEENIFCDRALHCAFERYPMEKRDRSFLARLAEGTVERCIEMDYVLNQFSKINVEKMKPAIRNILRLSVYQILYMDQVPDSAACNEAVKLTVKRNMKNLKGFVNGVLRNVAREKETISYPPKEDAVSYLSVRYSLPGWIVEELIRDYGMERAEKIAASFLKENDWLSIRCMAGKFSAEQVKEALEQEGVLVKEGKLAEGALQISHFSSLKELSAFNQGMFQVQDESSMLAGQVASVQKKDIVIDVCASPGGKTFYAADLCRDGQVFSCDLTEEKTVRLYENKKRLGIENVAIYVNDATVLKKEWIGKADIVIADLPCSGLGVIGKKCDIKYKTTKEDVLSLAKLQRQILSVVSQYAKIGGRLIFSTCTITREENQENAEWIEKNLLFSPVSLEEKLPKALQGLTGSKGFLQILPDMADTDGFFISCWERKE